MAMRAVIQSTVAVAGTTVAHTLQKAGVGTAPDEMWTMPNIAAGAGQTYRYATSDATNVYIASGTTACSVDLYVAINHSVVK